MKDTLVSLLKVIYSYVFNGFALIRMGRVGKNIFVRKGLCVVSPKGIIIGDNSRVGKHCRFECYKVDNILGKISIGNYVSINHYCSILCGANIKIGDYTRMASFITIMSENHGMNPERGIYHKQPLQCKEVNIGTYCWLGEKVIIMPGVTIGDWSIVGAGSLVTKNIPAYSIAVGNPARVIKQYNFETHSWEKPLS